MFEWIVIILIVVAAVGFLVWRVVRFMRSKRGAATRRATLTIDGRPRR